MTSYEKQSLQTVFSPLTKRNASLFSSLDKKYRSRLEILALILESMKDRGVATSLIRRQAKINHKQLGDYLKCLRSIGFIEAEVRDDQILYRASRKGLAFLTHYYVLWEMISEANSNGKPTLWLKHATYHSDWNICENLTSVDKLRNLSEKNGGEVGGKVRFSRF